MKKLIALATVAVMTMVAFADTETVSGITWTYTVKNGCASVGGGSTEFTAVPKSTVGAINHSVKVGRMQCYEYREICVPRLPRAYERGDAGRRDEHR